MPYTDIILDKNQILFSVRLCMVVIFGILGRHFKTYECVAHKPMNYVHFPTLSASQPNEATTYVAFVGQLREQFKTQFADQRANNQAFA